MTSSGDSGGGDVDLNLAPIIDCFTVLITYLLVSASFISLCAFDVGVAATGEAAPGATPPVPPYSLSLTVQTAQAIEIKLTGGPENVALTFPMPAKGGGFDWGGFGAKLKDLRDKYSTIKEANLSADPTIKYKEVMKVVEILKSVYPKVYLGG